jgi:predicted DNA-binding ribbon-helix-helix protein
MRNSRLKGHRVKAPHGVTNMRLAKEEWDAFNELRRREEISDTEAIGWAAGEGASGNLTSAVRMLLLGYYRAAATEAGHTAAGHGGAERLSGMVRRRWTTITGRRRAKPTSVDPPPEAEARAMSLALYRSSDANLNNPETPLRAQRYAFARLARGPTTKVLFFGVEDVPSSRCYSKHRAAPAFGPAHPGLHTASIGRAI